MKKARLLRFLTFTVLIALLSNCIFGIAAIALQELPITVPSEKIVRHIKRLYDEEFDNNIMLYENNDGSKTMYVYGEPVKYIDSNGRTLDKDISINVVDGVAGVEQNDFKLSFSNQVSSGATMSYKGHSIRLRIEPGLGSSTTRSDSLEKVAYSEAFGAATTLNLTPQFSGLKSDIVLTQNPGKTEFNYTLTAGELDLDSNDFGNKILVDQDKQTIFVFGDVIIYDAENNSAFGTATITPSDEINGRYTLTIAADGDFLNSSDTVYPVTISQTVSADTKTYYTINSRNISQQDTNGVPQYIYLGNRGTYSSPNMSYSQMLFPCIYDSVLLMGIKAEQIQSATLNLYCLQNYTTGSMHTSFTYYHSGNPKPSYSEISPYTETSCVSAYMGTLSAYNSIDITSIVKEWNQSNPNEQIKSGLILDACRVDECRKIYASPQNASSGQRPYLTITYTGTFREEANPNIVSGREYVIKNAASGDVMQISNDSLVKGELGSNSNLQKLTITLYTPPSSISCPAGLYYIKTSDGQYLTGQFGGLVKATTVGYLPSSEHLWYAITMPGNNIKFVSYAYPTAAMTFYDTNSTNHQYLRFDNTPGSWSQWKLIGNHIWYSQLDATGNWCSNLLDNTYVGSDNIPIMINYSSNNSSNCKMAEGCAIASVAMVLHNMGASFTNELEPSAEDNTYEKIRAVYLKNGFDMRRITDSYYLDADPFTVFLANNGLYTHHMVYDSTNNKYIFANSTGGSVTLQWETVAERFGVVENIRYSPTSAQIVSLLQQHPEGIVAVMKRTNGAQHVVVMTKYNSDGTISIYDPGTSLKTKGTARYISSTALSNFRFNGKDYSYIEKVVSFSRNGG